MKFEPLASQMDVAFWSRISDLKLNHLRLSEDWFPLTGFLSPTKHEGLSGRVEMEISSISSGAVAKDAPPDHAVRARRANGHAWGRDERPARPLPLPPPPPSSPSPRASGPRSPGSPGTRPTPCPGG